MRCGMRHHEETIMPDTESFFLALVVLAFATFALALIYARWQTADRLAAPDGFPED